MKTYKHNNEDLLSGESERILHKNAKNMRIKKQQEIRKQKRANILGYVFISLVSVGFIALFIIGGLMTR